MLLVEAVGWALLKSNGQHNHYKTHTLSLASSVTTRFADAPGILIAGAGWLAAGHAVGGGSGLGPVEEQWAARLPQDAHAVYGPGPHAGLRLGRLVQPRWARRAPADLADPLGVLGPAPSPGCLLPHSAQLCPGPLQARGGAPRVALEYIPAGLYPRMGQWCQQHQ